MQAHEFAVASEGSGAQRRSPTAAAISYGSAGRWKGTARDSAVNGLPRAAYSTTSSVRIPLEAYSVPSASQSVHTTA